MYVALSDIPTQHIRRAFEAEVEVSLPSLVRFVTGRCAQRDDVDDIVAETLAQAWHMQHRYDPAPGTMTAWLLGIAVVVARRHDSRWQRWRRGWEHLAPDRSQAPLSPATQAVDSIQSAHACECIRRALAAMRPAYREVLMLAADEALSEQDIAANLGVPVGTVKSRLHRARAELRRRVGPHLDQLGGAAS